MRSVWRIVWSLLVSLLVVGTSAAGPPPEHVTPSQIVKTFDLGGGIVFDLILTFEDATALAVDSLTIDAQLIDIEAIVCGVCVRMPQNVFIPGRFPVLVTIDPNQAGFTFRGKWGLEIVTENLEFSANSPLRLFHAATNVSPFEDMSLSAGLGSFRVRGISGSFSEFVIAADLRPVDPVVTGKFSRVDTILSNNGAAIDMAVLATLNNMLSAAETAFDQDDSNTAKATVNAMIGVVIQNSGSGIPDDWDPDGSALSIAGRLRGALRTLRFSLALVRRADTPESGSVRRSFNLAGSIEGTVILRFQEAFDFDLENLPGLGFSAQIINPLDFVNRLPVGVSIPEEFPVLLTIEPQSGQSFSSSFTLELITENLSFVGESPLRMFKAESGGNFKDISESYGLGSFRVRGISGSFSEFLVVSDLRPINAILGTKFNRLEALLDTHTVDIPPAVRSLFNQARVEFEADDFALAIDTLEEFVDAVDANRLTIPAVWLPDDSVVNVVGLSRGLAKSLRFNLVLKNTPITADPADVNRDGAVDVQDVFFVIDRVFGNGAPASSKSSEPAVREAESQPTHNP